MRLQDLRSTPSPSCKKETTVGVGTALREPHSFSMLGTQPLARPSA